MSFCSLTLMMTRLGPSAQSAGTRPANASATTQRRSMKQFLQEFALLSRGNCRRRAFAAAEVQPRHPLAERRKRDVKEADLEHRQERDGNPLAVIDREPEEIREINRERHFREGQERFKRHVFA